MIRLYLLWELIYLPVILMESVKDKGGILAGLLDAIRNMFFEGYYHLWYLPAMAVAILVVSFIIKRKISLKKAIIIVCVLYAVSLLGGPYFELLRPLSKFPVMWNILKLYAAIFESAGKFEGPLFVGIGALFAYKRIIIRDKPAVLLLIVSSICLFVEAFLVKHYGLARTYMNYIFLVPTIFFLFYLASHIDIRQSGFIRRLRSYSSLIYYTHIWIMVIINKIYASVFGNAYGAYSLSRFALVMICAVIISHIIIELEDIRGFRWLRNLQ